MDNPETLGVHKTQDEEKQNTKLKRWATQIPPKSEGELRCSQMESSSCFLQDTLCYSYIQSSLVKVLAVIFRGKKNLLFLFYFFWFTHRSVHFVGHVHVHYICRSYT
jgi:hypothetical protein